MMWAECHLDETMVPLSQIERACGRRACSRFGTVRCMNVGSGGWGLSVNASASERKRERERVRERKHMSFPSAHPPNSGPFDLPPRERAVPVLFLGHRTGEHMCSPFAAACVGRGERGHASAGNAVDGGGNGNDSAADGGRTRAALLPVA
jgi:hypothetical protein